MLVNRMIRAMKLESGLFEEVEHDTAATSQALTVVVIVSLAAGISGVLSALLGRNPGLAVTGLIGGLVAGIVTWLIWSLIIYFIGTSLMSGKATPGEVVRAVGFAYSPNVFQLFGFLGVLGGIPLLGGLLSLLGGLISLVAGIWTLIAGVIAVRQALDFDTTKAVITVVLGLVAVLIVGAVLGALGLGFLFMR